VPAKRRDRVRERPHHVERNDIPLALVVDEIETHAADAGFVERADLVRGNVRLDHRDAAQPLATPRQRIEQRAIVGAVDARLHQHRALDPEHAEQVQVVFQRRIRWRVDSLVCIGKALGGPANVRMGVAGARRQSRARRAGISVGRRTRKIGCSHFGLESETSKIDAGP
jgi:hypothetical protein